jgi:hypothetical protein
MTKKVASITLLAALVITPLAISAASANRAADAPECCQKKQGCCPGASCCTGGQHTMGVHCMLHAARS